MRYDVITVLDTCVDLIINMGNVVPEFNQKEKYIDSYSLEMGGSSCIFACQCSKLGLKTTGVGLLGDDIFGQVVSKSLSASGVDISHLRIDNTLNTALGVLLTRKSDRAILTYSGTIGAAGAEMITDELLGSARHLHIGSYFLLTRLHDALPEILARAKNLGLTVSLDTNWDPLENWKLSDELLASVDIIFPNEKEAMFLTGTTDIKEAIRRLEKKIPFVVVKLGAEGGIAAYEGKQIQLPPVDVKVADTVGAGDSFDAGFLYGFLRGLEPKECLRAGLYCGSMNTAKSGGIAGQPHLDELLEYL